MDHERELAAYRAAERALDEARAGYTGTSGDAA